MAEFVLVDLGAGLGDHVVDPAAALELHALSEQRAIAAFGEPARPDAERAVPFVMRMADPCQLRILVPGLELVRVHRRGIGAAYRIVDIGEADIVVELVMQDLDEFECVSAVDAVGAAGVDAPEYLAELGDRAEEHAEIPVLPDPGAVEFLRALAPEPEQIRLPRPDRGIPIGPNDFRLARPERARKIDQTPQIVANRHDFSYHSA